jgi:hypothetical protein
VTASLGLRTLGVEIWEISSVVRRFLETMSKHLFLSRVLEQVSKCHATTPNGTDNDGVVGSR